MPRLGLRALFLLAAMVASPVFGEASCRGELAVQVLGSGGPIADDGRASTGYLVWIDGHARVLIDAGSGTFVRFGEAGARFSDLDVIAISHFHTDHVGALPALLKTGYFSDRRRPLTLSGPAGGGPFPGLESWLSRTLDREAGAFAYLAGYLDGTGGLVELRPVEVALKGAEPAPVADGRARIEALPVPHGIVPSVAYRVAVGDKTLVFGSDQNGSNPAFGTFAQGADLLVLHAVIPESAGRAAQSLHATPSRLAAVVADAQPRRVLLSHWMARSLRVQEQILAAVQAVAEGPVQAAEDLLCIDLS